MPENVFRDLEAALRRHPNARRTLTDEIVGRLRASISREREHERDPASPAWGFLISEVGGYSHYQMPGWNRNPFWFRAFKLAVIGLLERLEPKGEIKPPKDIDPSEYEETPEAQAGAAVNAVLLQLHAGRSRQYRRYESEMPADAVTDDRTAETLDSAMAQAAAELESAEDAYEQVRQDLQIKPIWRQAKKGD
jgi:hypothetical protein